MAAAMPRASWGVISCSGRSRLGHGLLEQRGGRLIQRHRLPLVSWPEAADPARDKAERPNPFVAVGRDLVAFVPVAADAADVGQESRGLPGMLAPMYQDAALGHRVWLATC